MKRIVIPEKKRKNSPENWHIEAPGCIINIWPYLRNNKGEAVTSVEILPDSGYVLDGRINNIIIDKAEKRS